MASPEGIIKIHKILLTGILIMIAFVHSTPYSDKSKSSHSGVQNQLEKSSTFSSHFITKNNSQVIAQVGGLATLPCAVKYNSPATVSWIRRRDFQLLTVGLSTHSSDDRFLVEHTRHMGHWSLRIKSVRDVDKGLYECQLSIYPTQSIFVELKILEAVAQITGSPDLHIDEGSTLRLECKLERATELPTYVFWYHNNKMINYDTQDGYSVTTIDPSPELNINPNNSLVNNIYSSSSQEHISSYLLSSVISILSIKEVKFKHGGNYTCSPSNAKPAGIMVHVLRGEKLAAMQHANRSTIDENGKTSISITIHCSLNKNFLIIFILLNLFLNNQLNNQR